VITFDRNGRSQSPECAIGARFRQIAATEGVPAAVRWRSAQFKE
jgi:hypothetical protein